MVRYVHCAKQWTSLLMTVVLLGSFFVLNSFSPSTTHSQNRKTVVLYVNGIHTTSDAATNSLNLIRSRWNAYKSQVGISTEVVFDSSYNEHISADRDIWQAIDQALNLPAGTLANDTHDYGLLATVVYSNEVIKHRVRNSTTPDPDLETLKAKIKCYLLGGTQTAGATTCTNPGTKWSGNKVVLIGHSQGNFYINFAYEDLLQDTVFQNKLSVTLPNPNVLEVVGLATPTTYTADGRNKYLTLCNDPIRFVPGSLAENQKSSSCSWTSQLLRNITLATTSLSAAVLTRSSSPEIAKLARQVLSYAGEVTISPHALNETYLEAGSSQLQAVMQLIEDSLPDPGCGSDPNCYLKDNFGGGDFMDNFNRVLAQGSVYAGESANILWLYTYSSSARMALRSRRVFTGPFTLNFQFKIANVNNIAIGLFDTVDNMSDVALRYTQSIATPYPGQGISSPNFMRNFIAAGWHTVTFTKTDTQVKLYIDGQLWATNSTTQDVGYYLGFDLQIKNNMQIKELSVIRGATGPMLPPSPTPSISPTPKPSPSPSPTATPIISPTPTPTPQATPTPKGTVVIITNGTVPSVNCKLNGISVNGPGVFGNQTIGSKTLSCTPPSGFTLDSITPSETQTLVANGEITFKVSLSAIMPTPVISSLTVNTEPKVNVNINVSLFGSGFVQGTSKGYVCTSSSTSSCSSTTTLFIDSGQLTLTKVKSSTARKLYLRVKNSDSWSNYKTMVVIK